jgi:hypothetical protein
MQPTCRCGRRTDFSPGTKQCPECESVLSSRRTAEESLIQRFRKASLADSDGRLAIIVVLMIVVLGPIAAHVLLTTARVVAPV